MKFAGEVALSTFLASFGHFITLPAFVTTTAGVKAGVTFIRDCDEYGTYFAEEEVLRRGLAKH